MSEANKVQHGGSHYRTEYQHWDWSADVGYGHGYYLAAATKYVVRHQQKNGVEDLKKAKHYVDKLIELHREGRCPLPKRNRLNRTRVQEMTTRMLDANQSGVMERLIVSLLASPTSVNELESASEYIEDLIQMASVNDEMVAARAGNVLTDDDFRAEGWKRDADCYQCRVCGEHFEVPTAHRPSLQHLCPGAPGVAVTDPTQRATTAPTGSDEPTGDGSEATPAYVGQGI